MSEDNLVHATSASDTPQCDQLRARPYPFSAEQEAWLVDLETTDAPQTTGALHRLRRELDDEGEPMEPVGFCCLGRACVVLGAPSNAWKYHVNYRGHSDVLPDTEFKTLRLRDNIGTFSTAEEDHDCLTSLNDSHWTFKQIAAYIRANPWNVFLDPASPERSDDRSVGPHDEEAA